VADALLGSETVALGNVLRFASQDPAYWMVKQYRRVVLELLTLGADDLQDRLAALVEQTTPRGGDGDEGRRLPSAASV
jgi:hypothetical protein